MKLRYNRVLAAVMASALLLTQSGFSVYTGAQEQSGYTEDVEAAGEIAADDEEDDLPDSVVLTSGEETPDGEDSGEDNSKEKKEEEGSGQEMQTDEPSAQPQTPPEEDPVEPAAPAEPETPAPAAPEPETLPPVIAEPETPAPVVYEPDTQAPADIVPETPAQTEPVVNDGGNGQAEQGQDTAAVPEENTPSADNSEDRQNEERAEEADNEDNKPVNDDLIIDNDDDDDLDDFDDEEDFEDDEDDEDDEEESDEITGMAVSFVTSADGATVRARLMDVESLPDDTKLQVEHLDDESYAQMLADDLNDGHREVSGALAYRVSLVREDGSDAGAGQVELSFTYETPVSLGLFPYMEASAAAYSAENGMTLLNDLTLEETAGEEPLLGSAIAQIDSGSVVVFAGVQNHVPDGEEIDLNDIDRDLGDILKYTIAANEFNTDGTVSMEDTMLFAVPDVAAANLLDVSGAGALFGTPEETGEGDAGVEPEQDNTTFAPDDDFYPGENALTGELTEDKIRRRLELLSDFSLGLVDRRSTENLKVINVYADRDGYVSYEPLEAVLYENGFDLDVTNTHIIVNIVADHEDQDLVLPVFAVQNTDPQLTMDDTWATYGRILYNIVALRDREFVPYTGEAVMEYPTGGTWMAPEGTLVVKSALVGAAYADKVLAAPEAVFAKTAFAAYDDVPDGMNADTDSDGKAEFEMDAEEEAMIAAGSQQFEIPEEEIMDGDYDDDYSYRRKKKKSPRRMRKMLSRRKISRRRCIRRRLLRRQLCPIPAAVWQTWYCSCAMRPDLRSRTAMARKCPRGKPEMTERFRSALIQIHMVYLRKLWGQKRLRRLRSCPPVNIRPATIQLRRQRL